MITILIVLFLVIAVILLASLFLGRATHEVESARDTEYVELEGTWVRYSVIGGGPPVLLVHGWLSSSRIWEGLADRLAQRFTVYTLDLPGFGESDKPLYGYGVRNGSRLLYAFCAHFGLTGTGVVGHDLGGDMAVKLAADHPDVVGRLVLVSTPADEEQIDLPTPLWLATLPVVGPLFYALGRALSPVRRIWMRPFVADPKDLTQEVVDDAGRSTPAAAGKTLDVSRREISRGRLARQTRGIRIPFLVVAGEEDQIVDPRCVSSWADAVDRAEVCLLDECGHIPMIERTTEFNSRVLAFLTGDARYPGYVKKSPTTAVERDDYEDDDIEVETRYLEGDDERAPPTHLSEPPDGTTHLTPRRVKPVANPESQPPPRVIRKSRRGYPARDHDAEPRDFDPRRSPSSEDDLEDSRWTGDNVRRATPDEGFIPELPADLFDWPEPRTDFRSPERRRREPPEERNSSNHHDPEEPDRF